MNLFEIIGLKAPQISPETTKIHLAVWNGEDDPLDVYFKGEFEEWQSWQNKKNFPRKYIIPLIQMPGIDRWLFAGGYISKSSEYLEEHKYYRYKTECISELEYFSGKLIISFKRSGRQSYLNAETWYVKMIVAEIKPEKLIVEDFKGYNKIIISKSKLDLIVSQSIDSWRSALSNVSGVYLITDRATGKLYVGSATGGGGIWQRWCSYSLNGHGGNKNIITVLNKKGPEYADNFQYSILEIADTHTSKDDILERESYWKNVLCTRKYGYN